MRELSLPLYALFQLPAERIEIREVRIALEILLDLCDVHRICIGQELAVHMLAADHEVLSCGQRCKQLLDIVEEKDALRRFVVRISCQHIMDTARQDFGQTLEGLPPHDDGMPHGESLEPLQVIGKVPDELVILADDTVSGTGNNDRKAHTDTSIAILSW